MLWPELTVDENLLLVARLKGMHSEEITDQMELLKTLLYLEQHSGKLARNLSGGNKRKLCQAMALIKTPKIVFMDEASNGVDPISRKNLYSYLKSLKETAALIITHRIDEAEKICDKLAIMAGGKFLDMESPEKLKEKHGKVYMLQIEPSSAKGSLASVH